MLLLLRTCRRRQVGGLHRAPPDCGAGKFRAGACGWTIIAQDRFVGAVLSPRFFSRSLSWRAGERHCDLVLDRVTRQLRAAHQRAAIKTCRWGVTVHRRVGWEREEWGIGNRRAASFGPFVLLAQEVSFGGIQRCVERQPQLRVDMHRGDKLFAARTSAAPRLVCRDPGLNLACLDP